MAKKKQKGRANRAGMATPEALERKARDDLAAERWRDAATSLKQLLKQDPSEERRSLLADAYAGRARELTAKGMLKEALAIWENRAALDADLAFAPEHADLLLRLDRAEQVVALLADPDRLPRAARERLRSMLAARLLAGDPAPAAGLSPEDPVRRHAEPAQAALAAYCGGDDAALGAALAEIPFRSPYRDWAQILKAMARLPQAPTEVAAALERIGDDSAFVALRDAARMALLPQSDFIAAIAGARPRQIAVAAALRGWSPERTALALELAGLGAAPQPRALLGLLVRHRDTLGAAWVHRRALRLMIDDWPRSADWLRVLDGGANNLLDRRLISAWRTERTGDLWDELDGWEAVAQALMDEGANAKQRESDQADADRRLSIALVLRRVDAQHDVLAHAEPDPDDQDALDTLVAAQLAKSLEWDANHRETWLQLIEWNRRAGRRQELRRLVEEAARIWPKDLRVLEARLQTALDSGAFKKAAGLAKQMLAIDPINTGVRKQLVASHIAHAIKQLRKQRFDLARKELSEADQWAGGGPLREQMDLVLGVFRMLENPDAGAAELHARLQQLGGGLSAQVALAIACSELEGAPERLFTCLGVKPVPARDGDDLRAALARLRAFLEDNDRFSRALIDWLSTAFERAPWQTLTRAELELSCETLRRMRLYPLRLAAAKAALKQWPGEPVFELHAFEAAHAEDGRPPSGPEIWRLREAEERANEAGDMRTVQRIQELLYFESPFGGMPPFPNPTFDGNDWDDDGFGIDPGIDSDPDVPLPEAFADLLEILAPLPLRQLLDKLALPPQIRRDIERTAKREGEAAAKEALIEIVTIGAQIAEELDAGVADPPASGSKPGSRRRRGKKAGTATPQHKPGSSHASAPAPNDADADDFPKQLDLF